MNASNELLTAEELADRLRVRPGTIRMWSREGLIPVLRVGAKVVRVDYTDVIQVLKDRTKHGR